jgi:ABC-type amino acid transport system permease subunit
MLPRSRYLLIAMSISLALSAAGLIVGMLYDLYAVFLRHSQLESVLGRSIPYYKTVGGLGILGMILFFLFLLSLMASRQDKTNDRKR